MTNLHLKERNLPNNFRKRDVLEIKKLIDSSSSFAVVGMPSMGISIFLRYVCTQDFGLMVHVDIYELLDFTPNRLFELLRDKFGGDPKQQLEKLVKKHKRVVIVFNRFDSLKKAYTKELFAKLRSLIDVDRERIVMIFAANRPIADEFPEALEGGNLAKFSMTYYLKPYLEEELREMLELSAPGLLSNSNLEEIVKLSGGHYQLFLLLLKSTFKPNYLTDPAIRLQFKQLFGFLNYREKKQMQKIATGRQIKDIEIFLKKTGYSDFSPLFYQFIKVNMRLRLPVKEKQLFDFLKEKEGRIVLKDELFGILWGETGSSDWALNALVYRLRKNPTFVASGYQIESQKKVGYLLIKN